MSYANLIVENENGLTKVVINRPKVLNALNHETIEEMTDLFYRLEEDNDSVGILITGAGDKAFIAGADISELAEMNSTEAKLFSEKGHNLLNLIENMGKPVSAAVNGFALGGGLELAMACDFRYASEDAKMGQPEINLGLIPGFGGTQRLPRLVGKGLALELLQTGDMIDAQQALAFGLVNRVYPHAELLPAMEKVMHKIIRKSPVMLRFIQQAVNKGLSMTLKDGLALETNLFSICANCEDMREGTDAFLNKRKPAFKGR